MTIKNEDISGASMDIAIAPDKKRKYLKPAIIGMVVFFLLWMIINSDMSSTYKVVRKNVSINTVKTGIFEDYAFLSFTVKPRVSLSVDTITSGKVNKIYVENGAVLKKGDAIFELKSFDQELEIIEKESAANRNLGDVQKRRLELENRMMETLEQLATKKFLLKEQEQNLNRKRILAKSGDISRSQLDDLEENYALQKNNYELALKRQKNFEHNLIIQKKQLDSEEESYKRDLDFAIRLRDGMTIKAPMDGILSGFSVDIGQQINKNETVAAIYSPNTMKMVASVSEQFLEDIQLDQIAEIDYEGEKLQLKVGKIDPDINDGSFEVDFYFVEEAPESLHLGRSFSGKVHFKEPRSALLAANGAFINETGGHWVFVLDENESIASKRQVSLGEKNIRYIEVLEGLAEGEKIISSSYGSFLKMEKIYLVDD